MNLQFTPHLKDKQLYIETYGCQMNFADSEIVASIMKDYGYQNTQDVSTADLILINTCSVRDHAEQRIRKRLTEFRQIKKVNRNLKIGIIGCMAERLKEKLFTEEKMLDLIVGPDAYRSLPQLVAEIEDGQKAANVLLSTDETYGEINPVRYASNGISAFISIMRGCENFCSFCIVPFTRGKERSRNPDNILAEAKELVKAGYREVTLLGQNVNSYRWDPKGADFNFAKLLEQVALIDPQLRVRFTSSHPKDISDELLHTIAKHPNICKSIHLALQSGSSRVLDIMNRNYTREWFMERVNAIKTITPECTITTDVIAGFCTETEDEHQETISLMQWVAFDHAYMFKYSVREGTTAAKKYADDVPEEVKKRRLQEIIDSQRKVSELSNRNNVGSIFEILIEGESKKSSDYFSGRSSQNKMVVFPKGNYQKGEYVNVKITGHTSATLMGEVV